MIKFEEMTEKKLMNNKYYRMNKRIMKIKKNKELIKEIIGLIALAVEAIILTGIILAL